MEFGFHSLVRYDLVGVIPKQYNYVMQRALDIGHAHTTLFVLTALTQSQQTDIGLEGEMEHMFLLVTKTIAESESTRNLGRVALLPSLVGDWRRKEVK